MSKGPAGGPPCTTRPAKLGVQPQPGARALLTRRHFFSRSRRVNRNVERESDRSALYRPNGPKSLLDDATNVSLANPLKTDIYARCCLALAPRSPSRVRGELCTGSSPAPVQAHGGRVVYWPTRADPPRLDAVAKGRRSRLWTESGGRRSERSGPGPNTPRLSRSRPLRLQVPQIGRPIGTGFDLAAAVAERILVSCYMLNRQKGPSQVAGADAVRRCGGLRRVSSRQRSSFRMSIVLSPRPMLICECTPCPP